jgi:hypothetical protein
VNPKSATALLGVAILVGSEIALDHSDSLVPREHIHVEMLTESVATTASYMAASGMQTRQGQISADAVLLKQQSGEISVSAFLVKN